MKQVVAREHHFFFQKHRVIEFDDVFNEKQLAILLEEVDSALAARLQTEPEKISHQTSLALYMAGRDLWRHNMTLRKIICHHQLGKIAADLVQQTSLRIGFDQLLPSRAPTSNVIENKDGLAQLLEKTQSLNDYSHLQGTACGLMICLKSDESISEEDQVSVFSKKAGNVVFFDADLPVDFSKLENHSRSRYLLIAYTLANSMYILKENDPHGHELKHIGYSFGECLNEKLNPFVYR